MGYKHDGCASAAQLRQPVPAAHLKGVVANGEHLVYQQYIRLSAGGYCKAEANIHSGAICLYRSLEYARSKACKFGDRIVLAIDFTPAHAKNCPVDIYILAPAQHRMK